jgi:ATP-dependent helicase/nuclease subunit A
VLAARYAWLVLREHCSVDEILTLTFTNKAANEMYGRIYKTLTEHREDPRARRAIEEFHRAQIGTLDSFCARVARSAARRYGISPEFSTGNSAVRELAREEGLRFVLDKRNDPALRQLLADYRIRDIAGRIFVEGVLDYSCLSSPRSFTGDLAKQEAEALRVWKDLGRRTIETVRALEGGMRNMGSHKSVFFATLSSFFSSHPSIPPLPELGNITENSRRETESLFAYFEDLEAVGLPGGRVSEELDRLAEPLRKFKNEGGLHERLGALANFLLHRDLSAGVSALLEEFQDHVNRQKRRAGIMSFSDVSRLAVDALRDHPDLRGVFRDRISKIMVDEFQDNNSLQRDLIFLLAEEGGGEKRRVPGTEELAPEKMFFVGDEKQSIYRFRGADVSVFRQLKNELAAADLTLGINYRSSPDLIAAFNDLFQAGGVFLPGEKPPYEADYSPLRAHRAEPGNIGLYILDRAGKAGDEEDEDGGEQGEPFEDDENEAVFGAEKIRDLLAETGEDGNPRYRPEDIAILFRTRAPQRVFEKHLRLLGIPYAGEGLCGFFADGPVNDLAALLRLVSYPLDTEAYAVSLRSPFAGLSLGGLAICLSEFNALRERGGTPVPFSGTTPPLLEEPDRRAYEQGRDLYHRIREKAAALSIGELVSELWYREGYRYETEWNPQTGAYRELFDYLYGQAVKADSENLSLAAFTDRLTALRENEERLQDTELPLERPGAVRLLTIHKSKGLEFPVVFIAGCGRRARSNTNDEEIYASDDGGLSFNPPLPPECSRMNDLGRNFFYERDRLEEKRKAAAELRRLLYVAMTRAEDRLIITGSYSLGMEGGGAEDMASCLYRAIKQKREAREEKERKAGIRRLPGDSSLDDGTLFGLLLPALADRWLGPEQLGADKLRADKPMHPFLSLEPIPHYTREDIRRREDGGPYPNNRQGLSRFLAAAAPYYQGAEKIVTPRPVRDHLSPTSFHTALPGAGKGEIRSSAFDKKGEIRSSAFDKKGEIRSSAFDGEGGGELFTRVDRILARFAAPNGPAGVPAEGAAAGEASGAWGESFGPAEFGTLAHLSVEALLKGVEPVIPPRLAGLLSPGEGEILLSAGRELAERFLRSPLGKAAAESPFRRSEYPFRSFYPRLPPVGVGMEQNPGNAYMYISGTIDLLFDREDQVWVVDFKTDSAENPPEHLPQMAFYYRAARDLREKRCRIWLYYFRTGHAVELSGAAEAFNFFGTTALPV